MFTPEEAIERARTTYNAAADSFDSPALSFWDYFGRRTVARLDLHEGQSVLDAACGSGASAIPAATAVGPGGSVFGVDISERLLELAQRKAAQARLTNMKFKCSDMLALPTEDSGFDVVLCVFAIFFVPDMAGAARSLWQRVRPGGRLAITTWGSSLFEPGNTIFWNAVAGVRPDLHKAFNPWDRISSPAGLRKMFAEARIGTPEIEHEKRLQPVSTAQDWWTIVCGSGYRGTLEQLSAQEYDTVRQNNLIEFEQSRCRAVQIDALFGVATKSDDASTLD
jgi:SAM-dependent methyltransferase